MELLKDKYSINAEEIEILLDLEPGTLIEERTQENKGLVLILKRD